MGHAARHADRPAQAQLAPGRVLSLLDARLPRDHAIVPARGARAPSSRPCFAVFEPARASELGCPVSNMPGISRAGRRRGGGPFSPSWLPPAKPLGLLIGGFTDTTLQLEPATNAAECFPTASWSPRPAILGEGIDLLV